jgi:hypothetical protein
MRIGAAGSFWRDNGLSVVLVSLFIASLVGQAIAGWFESSEEALQHGRTPLAFGQYLLSGHFWEATGENWESEFLQMAMFVVLTSGSGRRGLPSPSASALSNPRSSIPGASRTSPTRPGRCGPADGGCASMRIRSV